MGKGFGQFEVSGNYTSGSYTSPAGPWLQFFWLLLLFLAVLARGRTWALLWAGLGFDWAGVGRDDCPGGVAGGLRGLSLSESLSETPSEWARGRGDRTEELEGRWRLQVGWTRYCRGRGPFCGGEGRLVWEKQHKITIQNIYNSQQLSQHWP